MFNKHQRALLSRRISRALAIIQSFADELNRHIDYEEHRLLPLYADKSAETAGGTLEIFQAEHRKLREEIAKLSRLTEELQKSQDVAGSILTLLDEETRFKGLLHHHATREQNLLFPRLEARTTDEEREMWLARS
jgi:iron-sulfur cluster repair protein YtfE (RIC family)